MTAQDLQSAAFPTLDREQLARLAGCGDAARRAYRAGETLFEVGERDFRFSVQFVHAALREM